MTDDPTARTVMRNEERSRYELLVDGEVVGVAEYRPGTGGRVVFPHTEIDRARRGNGLAAELVRAALDDVLVVGGTVDPRCWYVAQFIDENPEYQPLLSGPR